MRNDYKQISKNENMDEGPYKVEKDNAQLSQFYSFNILIVFDVL